MKQKLTLLLLALVTSIGAWASTYTVTLGSLVTDVSTLSTSKYYVLKNCGSSLYNYYDGTQMDAKSGYDYSCVVSLSYDGTNVTIKQVSTGTYYQGLVSDTRLTLGADAVSYTFNTDGVESGQFRFANNSLYMNRNASGYPIGYSTGGTGAYSRWNIYEVTVVETIEFDPNNVTGITFTLKCSRGYVYYNGTQLAGTSDASSASKFAIVSYNNNTYLYDATNNAFVCHTTAATAGTTGNAALESNNDFSKIVKNISFGSTEIDSYPYSVQENEFGNWLNMDGTPSVYFNTWKEFESGNGGNTYAIAVVDDTFDATVATQMLDAYFNPSATVQYVISDANGVVFTSEELPATPGETITELPSAYQRDFCSYSAINQTMVAGENTVNVTVTYDLPFEVGTGKKYLATLRGHYVYYDETNSDVRTNQSSKEYNDNYYWSFYGNPYSGIKMKNAATETYLDNTSTTVQLSAEGYSWTIVSLNSTSTFGLYNGSDYINEQNHDNHNLIYWSNFTGDSGSQWTVEAAPDGTVQVTYNLVIDGSTVNTSTIEQPVNSAVSVPSSLTANYSTLCYDFETSGTIGIEDCVISVTGTKKSGIVADLGELSNSKAYKLTTARGDLYIKSDHLASNYKDNAGAAAGSFAILNFEGNYYLYSTESSKFVQSDGSLSSDMTSNVVSISFAPQSTNHLFLMKIGTKGANVTDTNDNYEFLIDNWVTADPGNLYAIREVGDFDATDVLVEFDEFFKTAFANAITALKAIPFGSGLNQYSFTGDYADYTANASSVIAALEGAGYSSENLATAQDMLANYTINLPSAGFYRFKSNATGKYIGFAESGSQPMVDAGDACTYYYTASKQFLSYNRGRYLSGAVGNAVTAVGTEGPAFNFYESAYSNKTLGTYRIRVAGDASGSLIDWTDNFLNGWGTGDNARCEWTIETVDALPVTINSIDGHGFASFYTPVGISSLPSGVKAYIATLTADRVRFSEIISIPAGTAVVLYMPTCDANTTVELPIGDASASTTGNVLRGNVATVALGEQGVLTMQKVDEELGFYKFKGDNLAGFKAYINISDIPVGIKGFAFDFEDDATSIQNSKFNIQNEEAPIYNLAGQRLNKPVKGINIVNGKKVMVK